MLTVAIYDELTDQKPCVTGILVLAEKQKELPVRAIINMNPGKLLKDNDRLNGIDVFVFAAVTVDDVLLNYAKKIRATKPDAYIIFATNATKSNIQRLVTPSVGVSGLLFIPPEKEALYQTINEIAAERATLGDTGEVFTIKSGSEYRKIPLQSILFFQSKEKKIALSTDKQEIEFYSSLSAITGQIPDYFIRCYKSFIVNTKFIIAVDVSTMEISLTNGFKLPLSRQYKGDFKQFIKDGDKIG